MMRLASEKGQATVMAAITLPIFCGFLGLAIDVGSFYSLKRRIQTAADASARAAVLELKRGRRDLMASAANSAAAANGFASSAVTMNFPPRTGPYAGDQKFVEVIIDQETPTMFARFLIPRDNIEVLGRAVAGLSGVPPAGIFVLSRSRSRALEVSGGSSLTVELDVWVSSNSGSGVSVTSGSCMTAPAIGVTGGFEGSCFSSRPIPGMIPDEDPLVDLQPPSFSGSCDFTDVEVKHRTATLTPGVYCGGLEITNGANVLLLPGVYVLRGGGLNVHGNADLAGSGVVFYNTGDATYPAGNISIRSNSSVRLSAPVSGGLAGVLFFFDRALPPQSLEFGISSSADTVLEGTIYAINQHVNVHSGSRSNDMAPWMLVVSDTLTVHGGSALTVPARFDTSAVPSPILSPVLVE